MTFFPPWPTEGEGERYQIFRGFPISTPGGEEPRGRGLKRARFAWGRRPRPSANLHPEPADNIDPKMVAVVVVVVLYQRATPGRESWRRRGGGEEEDQLYPFFSPLFSPLDRDILVTIEFPGTRAKYSQLRMRISWRILLRN